MSNSCLHSPIPNDDDSHPILVLICNCTGHPEKTSISLSIPLTRMPVTDIEEAAQSCMTMVSQTLRIENA